MVYSLCMEANRTARLSHLIEVTSSGLSGHKKNMGVEGRITKGSISLYRHYKNMDKKSISKSQCFYSQPPGMVCSKAV